MFVLPNNDHAVRYCNGGDPKTIVVASLWNKRLLPLRQLTIST